MSHELESDIERKFVLWCRKQGHLCLKLRPMGNGRGFPDRTIILNNGRVVFIELKRANGEVSIHQRKWVERLLKRRQNACICWSFEQARKIIEKVSDYP